MSYTDIQKMLEELKRNTLVTVRVRSQSELVIPR